MADLRASGLGGVPKGTTADRPSSPSIGDVFYNGTLGCLEIYTSGGWYASSAPMAIPTIGAATDAGIGRAYSATGAAATVAFTQGTGGGLPNTFTATSNPGNITAQASSSPITVTGLTPGTAYTFTVVGTNNFGTSAATASSNSVTVTTIPQAPTIGTLSYVSNTSLSLTFTANATGGSAITNYKYSTDGVTYTAFSPAQTTSPLTFTGLSPNTSYSFYIKAVNSNGDSIASSVSNPVTTALTVTGGTLTSDSTYYYRTFTGNGNLTVSNSSINVDLLMVGGGGGGGRHSGGGGGAGGLVYRTSQTISPGTYQIAIGGGGPGKTGLYSESAGGPGVSGDNTTFNSLIAYGGGGGGDAGVGTNGLSGGSGGGGTRNNRTGGAATQPGSATGGFGNGGGQTTSGADANNYPGHGGGGAGGGGGVGNQTKAGNGGVGLQYSAFATATSTGDQGYYAGGGGANMQEATSPGDGGLGGGGAGGQPNSSDTGAGVNGMSNTGGGGGGNRYNAGFGDPNRQGNGGSGIVIIRYTKASVGG